MVLMVMLDTNICVYILKRRPIEVLSKFKTTQNIAISTIVYGELCYGVTHSPKSLQARRKDELIQFISLLQVVDWSQNAAEEYALIRADLQQKGTPIGNMDLLIAAHAKSLNAVLVTNNLKEFKRVAGLTCENWVAST